VFVYNIFLIWQVLCVLAFGIVLGSFTTALIHRVPKRQSWWNFSARSQCPKCKSFLKIRDLIPLYSWIKSKAKCRFCGQSISVLYPSVEIGVALSCLAVYLLLGLNVHSILVIATIPFLSAAFVIDIRHMILPNQLTLIVGALALIDIGFAVLGSAWDLKTAVLHLACPRIVAGAVFFMFASILAQVTKWLTRRNSLGMGDIKFFVVVGLWLGFELLSAFAVLAGILGIVSALYTQYVIKKTSKGGLFPFGPALIMSLYILLLFQGAHLI